MIEDAQEEFHVNRNKVLCRKTKILKGGPNNNLICNLHRLQYTVFSMRCIYIDVMHYILQHRVGSHYIGQRFRAQNIIWLTFGKSVPGQSVVVLSTPTVHYQPPTSTTFPALSAISVACVCLLDTHTHTFPQQQYIALQLEKLRNARISVTALFVRV